MEEFNLMEQTGKPFKGDKLVKLKLFLEMHNLSYEESIEYTITLMNDDYEIIGTGSADRNILKCIAIDSRYQGQGLLAKIMTNLIKFTYQQGNMHLFLFTKPKNEIMFQEFGFYGIANTQEILLMENKKNGIKNYVSQLRKETKALEYNVQNEKGIIGAIIANCNPFTYGHRYLMETAANQCDLLHVFIVSSDESDFSTNVRYQLAKEGVEDISNIILHKTSEYLISPATFPTYFIKEKGKVEEIRCRLDIEIFIRYIVSNLGITKRFVGTEPNCKVTGAYNEQLKKYLENYQVEVIEIQRKEESNVPISASLVRKKMAYEKWDELKILVPPSTYEYIISDKGKELAKKLAVKYQLQICNQAPKQF